ncbi:MAG: hypothetical protein R3B60_02860 [Candidatus Paceibacterota bacterium]
MSEKTEKYVILEKAVGETPLECTEKWRKTRPDLAGVPLAYAGRLDPMASGQLLVLVGEECKKQTEYHNLDKEYEFEILFGVSSDSGDVLGIITETTKKVIDENEIKSVLENMIGDIELPYPIFSSKTVKGIPLHTWTMEGRLNEIEIPTRKSKIYELELLETKELTREDIAKITLEKIETIPPVTDKRKALGNDFRRPKVRKSWQSFANFSAPEDRFTIAKVRCLSSSGTYMRTLAEVIAEKLGSKGLAFSIHRTQVFLTN